MSDPCTTPTAPTHCVCTRQFPLLWRGGKHKHFVMYASSNHAVVLHNVTLFVLLQQTAVLSDGVVFCVTTELTKSVPTHVGSLHHPNRPNALRLHKLIPLLWRGGKLMHFVMHAFNNHAVVLHNVTLFVLLQQTAVLSDRVVFCVTTELTKSVPTHVGSLHHPNRPNALRLHKLIPLLWRGGKLCLTGWSRHFCTSQFPSFGGVAGEA